MKNTRCQESDGFVLLPSRLAQRRTILQNCTISEQNCNYSPLATINTPGFYSANQSSVFCGAAIN
ncbi:MAG: hypothetical protein KA138_13675, partial [Saprospiraceae bacterium]|nr:hypothetical protein [Saprospiraceae bacterium]